MTTKLALSIATAVVVGILLVAALVVGHWSPKWGDRIALLTPLAMFQGALMILMTPNSPA